MIAFVDESFRSSPTGLYLVAAAVVVDDQADALRARVRSVIPPKQRRFHWHDESDRLRFRMLQEIARLDLVVLAHACRPATPVKQERARALCLQSMLWELHERKVGELVLESRQERNNVRDRATIAQTQRAGGAASDLRYRHAVPLTEPLLWVADAIAGTVSAKLSETDDRYLAVLPEELVFVTEIEP